MPSPSKLIAFLLVFFSGMSGLIYQVTWQNMLAIHLGSHALASTLILSVFFLFLSLGYAIIGKAAPTLIRNQLLLYGIIEGIIGAYCLYSPNFFEWLAAVFPTNPGGFALGLTLDFIFCSIFIGIPTFLMGGTIPVLTQGLASKFENSHRIHAWIYAVNTGGAFVGTLAAGFYLIERHGLPLTLIISSVINLVVGFISYVLARISPEDYSGIQAKSQATASGAKTKLFPILLFVSFVSGFYTFALENLIIRMAGITLGSTVYAYTIIVAAFILAIAIGSLFVSVFKEIVSIRFMIGTQLVLVLTSIGIYALIPKWPDLFARIRFLVFPHLLNFNFYWLLVCMGFVLLLIVPVGLLGMNLPLLFNYLRSKSKTLSSVVGRLYAWNTFGCALGASLGGYVAFKFMDGHQVFKFQLILMTLVLAALIFGLSMPKTKKNQLLSGGLVVGLMALIIFIRDWKPSDFSPGLFSSAYAPPKEENYTEYLSKLRNNKPNILFHKFDPNTLVNVLESGKSRSLYVNAKPDATSDGDSLTRSLTALLPIMLADQTRSIFISGLGAGLSASIANHQKGLENLEIAEISDGVIDALPYFDAYNKDLSKHSEKITFHHGDAYKILRSSQKTYDVIMTEASNPWVTGVEKLYTEEFLRNAKARLSENGIYSQWFPLFQMNEETYVTIVSTFAKVFPWTTVWSAKGLATVMLGSDKPPQISLTKLTERFETNRSWLETLGLKNPASILGLEVLPAFTTTKIKTLFPASHRLDHPILTYNAGRSFFANQNGSLDTVVSGILRTPIPRDQADAQFLYEAIQSGGKSLPEDFYKEAIAFHSSRAFAFTSNRLEYLYLKHYPKNKVVKMPPDLVERYQAIADGKPIKFRPKVSLKDDLINVVATFKTLSAMHFPLDWKNTARIFPKKCPDDSCIDQKWAMLISTLPLEAKADFAIPPRPNPATVETEFNKAAF